MDFWIGVVVAWVWISAMAVRLLNARARHTAKTASVPWPPCDVSVLPDFLEALDRDTDARRLFDELSSINKQRFVLSIEGARTTKTRLRRIAKAVETLRAGCM